MTKASPNNDAGGDGINILTDNDDGIMNSLITDKDFFFPNLLSLKIAKHVLITMK